MNKEPEKQKSKRYSGFRAKRSMYSTAKTHRHTSSERGKTRTRVYNARPSHAKKPHGAQRQQHHSKSGRGKTRQRSSSQARFPNIDKNRNGKDDVIPVLEEGVVRIVPLGGVEEIGKNMSAIQYGNDIIIVDCGFQFREDNTPGIDFILPNTSYLEDNRDKIRAIVVTHGHLDHIGGFPYIMENLGFPPIYSRRLTTVMIKKRQEEFPHLPKLDIREVEKNDTIQMGKIQVRFFSVTHTIPDSMGIIIDTPHGSIVHVGDLKIDTVDSVPTQAEVDEYKMFEKENVLLLMSDSTSVEKLGFSYPESEVHKNIEKIIKKVHGRLIIGTFASQLERIIKIIEIAEKHGKKIVVDGRSMKVNIEIVLELGMLKVKKGTIISLDEMKNTPENKVMILATGAQGDEFASLMRMANKTHRHIKISKNDTIILSSSIIPGNERPVQKLKDNLSRQGAHIIHYQIAGVHSGGHAHREDAKWIIKKINPKFFIPQHGYHYMHRVHAEIAHECGIPEKNIIIPDNGSIIEIRDKGEKIVRLKEMAPSSLRLVDGFSVGDIKEVLIRDRKMLAEDGMFVIIVTVNLKTGKLRKSPDIISRGFVYLRESQELLQQTRLIIKKTVEKSISGVHSINFDYVKSNITDEVSRFLFQKTNKRPIVIPVVLGI